MIDRKYRKFFAENAFRVCCRTKPSSVTGKLINPRVSGTFRSDGVLGKENLISEITVFVD